MPIAFHVKLDNCTVHITRAADNVNVGKKNRMDGLWFIPLKCCL